MSDDVFKRVVCWRMRQRRIALNLRQEDVAERADMSLRRYQDFEAGTRKFNPTLDTLLRFAEALESELGELLKRHTREEAKASLQENKRRVFRATDKRD